MQANKRSPQDLSPGKKLFQRRMQGEMLPTGQSRGESRPLGEDAVTDDLGSFSVAVFLSLRAPVSLHTDC